MLTSGEIVIPSSHDAASRGRRRIICSKFSLIFPNPSAQIEIFFRGRYDFELLQKVPHVNSDNVPGEEFVHVFEFSAVLLLFQGHHNPEWGGFGHTKKKREPILCT